MMDLAMAGTWADISDKAQLDSFLAASHGPLKCLDGQTLTCVTSLYCKTPTKLRPCRIYHGQEPSAVCELLHGTQN